jgi:hypothetical protein
VSGETNSEPANTGASGASGVAGRPEPIEPLEERIARAVSEALEPFVVSLLAALIAPSQCAQGIDQESEDQRRKAIRLGQTLIDEARTGLREVSAQIARYGSELEAQKQQLEMRLTQEFLFLDMKRGDDPFRQYLREQSDSKKIQDRDVLAHFRALVKLGLGGSLHTTRAANQELLGYYIPKNTADKYLEFERRKVSDATARSRAGKPAKKNP